MDAGKGVPDKIQGLPEPLSWPRKMTNCYFTVGNGPNRNRPDRDYLPPCWDWICRCTRRTGKTVSCAGKRWLSRNQTSAGSLPQPWCSSLWLLPQPWWYSWRRLRTREIRLYVLTECAREIGRQLTKNTNDDGNYEKSKEKKTRTPREKNLRWTSR